MTAAVVVEMDAEKFEVKSARHEDSVEKTKFLSTPPGLSHTNLHFNFV